MSMIFSGNSKISFHLPKTYPFVDVEILRNCSINQQNPVLPVSFNRKSNVSLSCCNLGICLSRFYVIPVSVFIWCDSGISKYI